MVAINSKRPIVILDSESQLGHLFARRVRQLGYYSEVWPSSTPIEKLRHAAGIVLSGGRHSVYEPHSPHVDPRLYSLDVPILGLCYGLHLMAYDQGGKVKRGKKREDGPTQVTIEDAQNPLFRHCPVSFQVIMSHGDVATRLPRGYKCIAHTELCANAGFADEARRRFALQFHPEAQHSEYGQTIIRNFVELCLPSPWSVEGYLPALKQAIREQVGNRQVFVLVSGGIDSLVTFTLLCQVLGPERVHGVFVDTGLMRHDEPYEVQAMMARQGAVNFKVFDASKLFLSRLQGITDTEEKRRITDETFVIVVDTLFEQMGISYETGWLLAQGTIYPDTVESGRIKTHHNRGPAITKLLEEGHVIEPLQDLYKDEVRWLGLELGLSRADVGRHPFPGPAYAIRILGAKGPNYPSWLASLRRFLPGRAITVPHVVLPVRSVGTQGDGRTYKHAVMLFAPVPTFFPEYYWNLATAIPNLRPEFNRVLMCLTHYGPFRMRFTAGGITQSRVELAREADWIVNRVIRENGLYDKIWQFPVIVLPCGPAHGSYTIVLRPVESQDAMTALPYRLPAHVLRKLTDRLLELSDVGVVALDLTPKPPGTIEWE